MFLCEQANTRIVFGHHHTGRQSNSATQHTGHIVHSAGNGQRLATTRLWQRLALSQYLQVCPVDEDHRCLHLPLGY